MTNKNAIIVFLKAPEKGKVKTRLSRDLGEDFVLKLYKGFIHDLLESLKPLGNLLVYVWPGEGQECLEAVIGKDYELLNQRGSDLGEKMSNAFEDVFQKGFEKAILIGSDIPEITSDLILEAFLVLEEKDAVMGPSSDGGYYLIGFQVSGFSKTVFDRVEWSTPRVLAQTLETMDNIELAYSRLSILEDIDTLEDFNALAGRVNKGQSIGKRTRALIEAYET